MSDVVRHPGTLREGTDAQWAHFQQCMDIAENFGRLVASGRLSEECARSTLAVLMPYSTAVQTPFTLPLHKNLGEGLWAFERALSNWRYLCDRAPSKIKEAIRPFIEARQPSCEILRTAIIANAGLGDPLSASNLRAVVENELSWACRRMKPRSMEAAHG